VLRNKSKKRIMCKKVVFMRGLKKIVGLMFKRDLAKDEAWIFEIDKPGRLSSGVHTFFCLSDILVVWLNEKSEVIDLKVMKPFSMKIPRKEAKWVIEMSPKLRKLVNLGDKLVFPPVSN